MNHCRTGTIDTQRSPLSIRMEAEHDELATNPFFTALQSQTKLMESIAKDDAIVCVPASESLKLCKLTNEFIQSHILVASPHFADTYTTRNGKSVTFKDGRVICRQGFPRPRTVMVVYEETYYDDDFNSIKILRTNFPLEGKIPMGYYKLVANQASLDVATLNARTLPEHQLVLCKLSGAMYAHFANSPFSPEQALANIGASPSPHLVALPSLPPIFNSLQKFNLSFNTSYVLVKGFVEHAGTKVKDACDRMKTELCGPPPAAATPATKGVSKSSSASAPPKISRLTSMEASAAIEACVFAGIHRKLFLGLIELYKGEESRTQSLLAACANISQADLGVRPELRCNPVEAIQHLSQALNGSYAITPLQKLSVLEDTNRLLTQAVDAELAAAKAASNAANESNPGGEPTEKQDVTLAADDMLPFWIHLLLQARPAYIHANLEYLLHFQPNSAFINISALKVHLANLQGALQYVDSGKLNNHGGPGLNTGALDAFGNPLVKRRTASTIVVNNSFADLSLRDASAGSVNGALPVSRTPQQMATRKVGGAAGVGVQRTNSQSFLDSIDDGFDELISNQPINLHARGLTATQSHPNGFGHARNQSGGSGLQQLNTALTPREVSHSSSARPSAQRTASVSYPNHPLTSSHSQHATLGDRGGPSTGPNLIRMQDVQSNNRSSRDRTDMGDFLSNLKQQDDIVTGRLAKGQTLFGSPASAGPTNHGPASSVVSHATPVAARRPSSNANVLQLDGEDLPPLIVQRTTPQSGSRR